MKVEKINGKNYLLIPSQMDLNKIGRIKILLDDNGWNYNIQYNNNATLKSFPTSKLYEINKFIKLKNKEGYILIENNKYIGHVILEKRFNNTLYIEDFDIDESYRNKGYAKFLMDKVIKTAKNYNVNVVSLEVQDTNVIAFKFYIRYGFEIGGYDNLFYKEVNVQKNDNAVYLYLNVNKILK